MENIFVVNGSIQLILVPQNEMDRVLLEKLTSSGPITLTHISQSIGILGRSVKDAVVISPNKPVLDDTDKT